MCERTVGRAFLRFLRARRHIVYVRSVTSCLDHFEAGQAASLDRSPGKSGSGTARPVVASKSAVRSGSPRNNLGASSPAETDELKSKKTRGFGTRDAPSVRREGAAADSTAASGQNSGQLGRQVPSSSMAQDEASGVCDCPDHTPPNSSPGRVYRARSSGPIEVITARRGIHDTALERGLDEEKTSCHG